MQVRLTSGALALLAGLSLSACDSDGAGSMSAAGAAASPVASEPPAGVGTDATVTPDSAVRSGTGSRLDCPGSQLAVGMSHHSVQPGVEVERAFDHPTQLARGWFSRQVRNPSWASSGPFTIEQADVRTKSGERKIRVDFRTADGRIIGTYGVLWVPKLGWTGGGSRSCANPASGEPAAAPTASPASDVVFYRAMFSPRAISSRLACAGQGGTDGVFDRRSEPPSHPRSAEQVVSDWASNQSNRTNPDWDDAARPRPRFYYPRDPANAYRAVVDFVTAEGRVVASLTLDRWPNSDAWHIGSISSCGIASARRIGNP